MIDRIKNRKHQRLLRQKWYGDDLLIIKMDYSHYFPRVIDDMCRKHPELKKILEATVGLPIHNIYPIDPYNFPTLIHT